MNGDYAFGERNFSYAANNGVAEVDSYGVADPIIADGYSGGTPIQGAPYNQNPSTYRSEYYSVGQSTVQVSDTDLHDKIYDENTTGDGTIIGIVTFASAQQNLVESYGYSPNLDRTFETDYRGNRTDYLYDAYGSLVAQADPQVSTSEGAFRPTTYYSYDTTSGSSAYNIVAFCDPEYSNAHGMNWTTTPSASDSLCPRASGATLMNWTYPSYQTAGELQGIQKPSGYLKSLTYPTSSTDYGLPTALTGQSITQNDGTTRTPTDTFGYDNFGNIQTYNKGNGTWQVAYDSENRLTSTTDPDGVIDESRSYYPDDLLKTRQLAAESAGGFPATFTYDADGNESTEVHHYGYVNGSTYSAGTTSRWYDGDDRLVEVEMPQDSSDFYTFPWLTRYIYDLSKGQTLATPSFNGVSLNAFGNLYKTQELLTGSQATWTEAQRTSSGSPTFRDTKGSQFDAVDRKLDDYIISPANNQTETKTFQYDANNQIGLLNHKCNAVNQCADITYDQRGAEAAVTFTSSTGEPSSQNQQFTYDANGRTAVTSYAGLGSWTNAYDIDGDLITKSEGAVSGFTSAATMSYKYYGDGEKSSLSVNSSALTASPLQSYSYRADGKMQTEAITAPGVVFSIARTFEPSGRFLQQSESGPSVSGQTSTSYSYDSYGRLSSLSVPYENISISQYDDEGAPTSGTGTNPTHPLAGAYSTRNEAEALFYISNSASAVASTALANGLIVSPSLISTSPYTCDTGSETFDAASSSVLSTSSATTHPVGGSCTNNETVVTFGYDAANRSISMTSSNGNAIGALPKYTRSYDSEDHIVAQQGQGVRTYTNCQNYSLAYVWGPENHPILLGGTAANVQYNVKVGCQNGTLPALKSASLHWDGATLLFVTDSTGALQDLKTDSTADYTPQDASYKGVTFWDRGFDGTALACHTTEGSGVVNYYAARAVTDSCSSGQVRIADGDGFSTVGTSGIIFQSGADGYSDGYNVIQGVRSFDPQLGAFTTPDVYAGNVTDPMSRKPFVWDGNNPTVYSDPSGYCPACAAVLGGAGVEIGVGDLLTVLGAGAAGSVLTNQGQSVFQATGRVFGAIGNMMSGSADRYRLGLNVPGVKENRNRIADHIRKQNDARTKGEKTLVDYYDKEIQKFRNEIDKDLQQADRNKRDPRTEESTRPPDEPQSNAPTESGSTEEK